MLHESPHTPDVHVDVPLDAVGHTWPHDAQFCGSLAVVVQTLPHIVSVQTAVQTPLVQIWPPVHARPQPPQFALSESGFTHDAPQAVRPDALHVQTPLEQTWPAEHAWKQTPQFALSLATLTQLVPQCVAPPGHTHTPPRHESSDAQP